MTIRSAVLGALALACALSAPVALADPAGKTTLDETIRAASGIVINPAGLMVGWAKY